MGLADILTNGWHLRGGSFSRKLKTNIEKIYYIITLQRMSFGIKHLGNVRTLQ